MSMMISLTDEMNTGLDVNFFEQVTLAASKYLSSNELMNKSISILITGDNTIREFNKQYRGKDTPTDVLSFEMLEDTILGDIVISYDTAKLMAIEYELTITNEIIFLYIHGLLHLLGYDHELSSDDEEQMFKIQKSIFDITKK